jgi:hypothetical protein
MNGTLRALVISIFVLLSIACAGVAYLLFEPATVPIRYFDGDIWNERGQVQMTFKAGETIYPHRKFEIIRDTNLSSMKYLIDENTKVIVMRSDVTNSYWAKGHYERAAPVVLPKYLPPGKYAYHLLGSAPVNALRSDVRYEAPALHLQIVP